MGYTLDTEEDYFQINTATGSITLTQPAQAIPVGDYPVTARCFDSKITTTQQYTFSRIEQNEYAPVFSHEAALSVTISASKAGMLIVDVNATDMDLGVYGDITYSLSGDMVNSLFNLDTSNGKLSLKNNPQFLYSIYMITITASTINDIESDVSYMALAGITATVNFSPTFSQSIYAKSEFEDQTPSVGFLNVSCTDTETSSDELIYTLTGTGSESFSINSMGQLISLMELDCDVNPEFYEFTVVCSDGVETDEATIQINVQPENEYNPSLKSKLVGAFFYFLYESSLPENPNEYFLLSQYGSPALYKITANDLDDCDDSDKDLTFELGAFEDFDAKDGVVFDPTNGDLRFAEDFDIDDYGKSSLTGSPILTACDPGQRCTSTLGNHFVLLVDADELPMFDQDSYSVTIKENDESVIESPVLTVRCYDHDFVTGSIKGLEFYSKVGSNFYKTPTPILDDEDREIITQINLNHALDYENATSHSFILRCFDNENEAFTNITINVLPVNDLPPVFTQVTYVWNISRTIPGDEDYVVGTVLAVDGDLEVGNDVQYSIATGSENAYRFDINENGEVILVESISDYTQGTMSFQVKATDNDELHEAFAFILIYLETGNYEAPVFEEGLQVIDIDELEPIGSSLLSVFCNDTEEGDNGLVSYEIYSGNSGNAFKIDSKTGEITVNNLLILPQGEDTSIYNLNIRCMDQGVPSLAAHGSVLIRVFKADIFTPDIKNETIFVFVDEGVPLNYHATTITAEDLDTENLDYSFLNESVPDAFVILDVLNEGEVRVNTDIDRETVSEYSMTVVAKEVPGENFIGPVKNDSAAVFIYIRDINDNTPDCGLLSDIVQISNRLKLDRTVYQLDCRDDDVGSNGNITYTLENDFGVIGIDDSGRIYLENPLNESNVSSFYLEITVSDQGSVQQNEIDLSILVVVMSTNDHMPVFTNLPESINVNEDSGTFDPIFTVMAEDEDKGIHGVVRYGLKDESSLPFRLIPNTGELYITESLDYHSQTSYVLNVTASDKDFVAYGTLKISIVDVNEYAPECTSTLFTKSITESVSPSIVEPINLGCTDSDQGSNGDLLYTITSGNVDDVFSISDGSVQLDEALDFESKEEYELIVRVSDLGDPSLFTTITVKIQVSPINEHPPVLGVTSFTESIVEGTDVGFSVFIVKASDEDNGIHGELKYSLDPTQSDFGITNSGELLVTGNLDRERISNYNFDVLVQDSGTSSTTSTATVVINILDKDDNLPSFTKDLYTSIVDAENAIVNYLVATVNCTDPDNQANSAVTYAIVESDDSEYFEISNEGDITISQNLPVSSIYSFGVMCFGVSNPNYTDTSQVSITIKIDSNITFSEAVYNVELPEDTVTGTFLTITASSINNSTLTYKLVDSPTIFQLSQLSGELMLVGGLDYESTQSYILEVQATDAGLPPNMANVAVNVIVENVNDESPLFEVSGDTITVTEEESDYASLGTYTCSDGDLGDFGKVTYTLSGDDESYFHLDETSGQLLLNNPINYEDVQAFTLQITCNDGGNPAKSDVLSVPVTVTAVNEFAPTFSTSVVEISVDESIPVPSFLTISDELVAIDNDASPHDNTYYSIISGNDDSTFYISSTDGSLSLVAKLDYETTKSYQLIVMVDDGGGVNDPGYPVLNSTVDVEIVVSDSNDNSPVLDKSVYVGSLSESSEIEDHVEMVTLICTDEDSGDNGDTLLTFVAGNEDGIFSIDDSNGKIVLQKEVDFETNTFYTLTVRCSDQGAQPRYDEASLTINIEEHSEYGPIFQQEIYEFSVNETVLPGHIVGKVAAVDADSGTSGDILYKADMSAGPFAIDSDSGVITVSVPIDYESPPTSFVFNVTAEDPAKTKDLTIVAIDIINIDDNKPKFPQDNYFGTISENSGPGQAVNFNSVISCSDADDEADNISPTYSISSNTIPFSIDSVDGSISSNNLLDLETQDRYEFTVFCSDSSNSITSAIVTIDIDPYNDFFPEFLDTPYKTTIPENFGTSNSVFEVSAIDKDKVKYQKITFSISAGNDRGDFSIDGTAGIVRVAKELDYEEVTNYTLTIAATNIIADDDTSGSPSLVSYTEFNINITDINDNDPVITFTSNSVLVSNEQAGFHVTTATCEDPDSGSFGDVSMALIGSNAIQFELLSNGTIITKTVIIQDLVLQVNCTDSGNPARYTIADVTIITDDSNDFFPEFDFISKTFTIFENHTVGDDIGCVQATDEDGPETPSGTLTYSLSLDSNGEDSFAVIEDTGCIFVIVALDYDDQSSYEYTIKATDGGVNTKFAVAQIIIDVQNVEFDPPQFSEPSIARTISEGFPAGALITQSLVCTDRDDDDIITYSISSGNNDGTFTVDNTTARVTLAKPVDYETTTSHVVTLRCTDSSNLYDEAVISITVDPVNEHTPVIKEKLVHADEESPVGTKITIIEYTDLDDGPDGEVLFEIVEEYATGLFFVVNHVLYFNSTLDRDNGDTVYPIKLIVTDKAEFSKSSEGFVNVSLTDINDNAPIPMESIYIAPEVDATVNSSYLIDIVNCTDADKGANKDIDYTIEDNPLLSVDISSGFVTVKGDLRERDTHTIAFTITCTDKGVPTLSASFPIQVPVHDPNLHNPMFVNSSYSAVLPENYDLSTVFLTVAATDRDVGLNGDLEYSLTDDFDNLFYIDAEIGEISLLKELDFETIDTYNLEVLAVDGAIDSPERKTASVIVDIQVTGVNEFTPECKKPIYTAIISEDTTGPVVQLNCEDSDSGIDGELDYFITPGGHSDLFSVNGSGWVSVINAITPNASIEIYEVFVTVTDEGSPSKEYQVEVNFIYSFENLNSPVFAEDFYTHSALESTLVGTVVLTVVANDADPGLQGKVVYSVTGTNYFRANPQTGEIYVSEELDYETEQSISFLAWATDSDPSEPRSANVSVTVEVTDINDNSPTCDKAFYSVEIGSSLALNETVFDISGFCSDADGPENSILSYSLAPKNTFNIRAEAGMIFVNGPLEEGTSSALTVTVTDSGAPSLSTNVTVSVIVRFDNVAAPQFGNTSYSFTVNEDADLLTIIGQVVATDTDTPSNDLQYTLDSSNFKDIFYIDPQSGDVILTNQLDYETTTTYEIRVKVEDSGNYDGTNKLSDTVTVYINVDNVNDNLPTLNSNGLYGVIVNKTTAIDETVITITCTDADSSPYSNPSIPTSGFTSDVPFKLVESDDQWEVQVSSDLTIVNGSMSYDVNFTCRDEGGKEVVGQVFLSVPDVDAPVFNQSSYEWNIPEDTESGDTFTSIKATSQDDSTVVYEIIDGNTESIFYVHPNTGVVSLTGSLDFEEKSSYALVIEATDGKQRASTVLLRVFVIDIDDNVPLVPPSAFLTLEHNKPEGYPIGTVDCVDNDYLGGNFSFSFVEPSSEFAINNDGIITIESTLDETPVYVLPVTCYDNSDPGAVSTGVVTIEIIFVNIYEPEFELSSYTVSVNENADINSLVVSVNANDDDIGNQGQVSYSITAGNEDKFYVDTSTGDISVLTGLDRETKDTYVLTVEAFDGGIVNTTARKTGTTTVTVHVLDVNDNSPTFSAQSYLSTILTNHTVLSEVVQVQCSDPDLGVNGEFSYSIIPVHQSFLIDTNGTITLAETQSDETVYNFYAYCTDKGDPVLSASALITVAINEAEFGDPVFTNDSYSVSIPEDQELLDTFLTVFATGENTEINVAYSIIAGNTANKFTINANTGEISLVESVDYNTLSEYTLTVKATTVSFVEKSSQVLVSVSVTDVNDNSPVFSPLPFYHGQVYENDDIQTPVVQVNCTDQDISDVLTYSIAGENPPNGGLYFDITNSGLVTVKQSLDYETTSVYTLNVECSDGENTADATVRVDINPVNEFKPVFLQSVYIFTVDENTEIGETIGYVNATDKDAGTDGEIIFLVNDPGDLSPVFIDPTSGAILLSNLLDYETQDFHSISVIARDGSGSESNVQVEITVNNLNDEPPVLTPAVTTYSGRVTTDSPVGFFIKYFTCTDPDGSITTTIITSGNNQGYFKLNSFGQLVWNGTSDTFDSDIVVSIMLTCTDEANDEDTASIAIVVGKPGVEPPTFSSEEYKDTVHENSTTSTEVLSVLASPFLSNHTIEYSLFSFDVALPFAIDSFSGLITVNGSLDFEDVTSYTFPVQAKDVEDGSIALAEVEITVLDINDNHPIILPSSITVYVKEDAGVDVAYSKFTCSDMDSEMNGETTFAIEGTDLFRISKSSGSVYLNNSLDYEKTILHNITVTCTDSGNPKLTGSATLIVLVTGINEHPPVFKQDSYNFETPENSELNLLIGSVNATDKDAGINGEFLYNLLGGNGLDYFRIGEQSGDIFIKDTLNASMSNELTLVIGATDNGPPSAFVSDVLVNIDVTDVNEKPYFDQLSYLSSIATDTAVPGDILGTVTCYDYDLGSNADLFMNIAQNENLANNVSLVGDLAGNGSVSGDIVLTTTVDGGSYEILINCTDSGNPSLSTTVSFVVLVKAVNLPPSFSMPNYGLSIPEDFETDKSLLAVQATDPEGSSITYALLGGVGLGTFRIDEDNGELSLIQGLDYEITETYTLTVGAIDHDNINPQTGSAAILVKVVNVNDIAPSIQQPTSSLSLDEGTYTDPKTLKQFTCSDGDMGTTSLSVSPEPPFGIADDGQVYFLGIADYETQSSFVATVTCTDSPIADSDLPKSSSVTLTVAIKAVNFFAPELTSESVFDVSESSQAGSVLLQLTATDPDGRGAISFSTESHLDVFTLNSVSGELSLIDSLDRETKDSYTLTIEISDGDTLEPPMLTTVEITVTVTDINDNSPSCSSTLETITINANTYSSPLQLYNASCSDKDVGNNSELVYTIQEGSLPSEGSFELNSMTGQLTFNGTITKISTAAVVVIIVSDLGDQELVTPAKVQLILTVVTGDEPYFEPNRFSVNISENTAPLVPIFNGSEFLNALKNADGDISFTFLTNTSVFIIDFVTGDVLLLSSDVLDYDQGLQMYSLGIRTNVGTEVAEVILDVIITDYNDNAPQFSAVKYDGSILENLDVSDFVIATVSASDIDSGVNNDVTYSISSGGDNFKIDQHSGEITAKKTFDREFISDYTIIVVAKDGGEPVLSSSASVSIEIGDENDNAPVFTIEEYIINVADNSKVGSVLEIFTAEDQDITENLKFSLEASSAEDSIPDFVTIDPVNGELRQIGSIASNHASRYSFQVVANDVVHEVKASVILYVATVSSMQIYWKEETPDQTENIFSFLTNNYNISTNAEYEITEGNTDGLFEFVGDGILTHTELLDRENTSSYYITVLVSDNKTNENFYVFLEVTITDINDNAPIFENDRYQFNISEGDYSTDTLIGNVQAYDIDAPFSKNSRIDYTLQDNQDKSILGAKINIETGDVTIAGALDGDNRNHYILIAIAEDNGEPSRLLSIVTIDVYLSDLNDNVPRFSVRFLVGFTIYFVFNSTGNSQPYRTVAETDFGTTEVDYIRFEDPDSSDMPLASIQGTNDFALVSPLSPLEIVTLNGATFDLNDTFFFIKISDGLANHDRFTNVSVIVTRAESTSVAPTSTMRVMRSTIATTATGTVTIEPTIERTEDFFESPVGIAIVVVGSVLIFALAFFLCCLMCFCYQRYRYAQDKKKG